MQTIARKHNSSGPEDYTGADPGDDVCPNCQLYTSPGFFACDQCGTRLRPTADWPALRADESVVCPQDGAGMPADSVFCGYCGRVLPGRAHAELYRQQTPVVAADTPYPVSSSGRKPRRVLNRRTGEIAVLPDDDADLSPEGREAYLQSIGYAARADDGAGWLRDAASAEDDEARALAEFEDAALAMREGWSLEAARRWERAGAAWDAARQRAESARRGFDQLSQPYAGLPPVEATADSGLLMDDYWPDLSLPRDADDGLVDIRGRSRV
ncbi:MAG: zinc ribbon domain-containing protein [Streptosporangiaceae bacterium]